MKRTHLDLFSGIGGFALAARWAGVQTIGFAEIDDYASRVLAKNFPGVTNYGDVRNVPGDISTWLVTGGFPCQPFSVAGKRAGASDDRWLWPEMAGVIERIRPTWVLGENVPGVIRMELDTVLSDLERIGYTVQAFAIPAVGVDAPHRRERVWIVGNAKRSGQSGHDGRRTNQEPARRRAHVADADRRRFQQRDKAKRTVSITDKIGDVSDANDARRAQQRRAITDGTEYAPPERSCRWATEPDVGRVAHGIPARVDRLRGLGNAIVPQVAYQLIRMMIEAEESL